MEVRFNYVKAAGHMQVTMLDHMIESWKYPLVSQVPHGTE